MPKDIMALPLDECLDSYDAAELEALDMLAAKGLSGPDKPPVKQDGTSYDGRIPHNVGSRPPAEIGMWMELQTGYANYVSWQRQIAEATILTTKEKLSVTEAAVRRTKTGSVQSRKDATLVDHRYVEANTNWMRAKTYYMLLENLEQAARRDLKSLSRLVETKKMEMESGRRLSNMDSPSSSANRMKASSRRERRRGGYRGRSSAGED